MNEYFCSGVHDSIGIRRLDVGRNAPECTADEVGYDLVHFNIVAWELNLNQSSVFVFES